MFISSKVLTCILYLVSLLANLIFIPCFPIAKLKFSLSVIANVVMNSGEAFVKALADSLHKNFGNLKVFFDVSCVVTAVILSLVFFNMKIEGTREGTIVAALLTGIVVKFYLKFLNKPLDKLLTR